MQITVNGKPMPLEHPVTAAELLERLAVPDGRAAVVVNDDVIPRPRHPSHVLRDGDRVEILTFAGGG